MRPDQLFECPFSVVTCRQLCPDIAHHIDRLSRVALDHLENCFVRFPRLEKLEYRNAKTFLENFTGIDRHPAGGDTTNIRLVSKGRNKAFQFSGDEHRLDDIEVRKMHSAGAIGVIENINIALLEITFVSLCQVPHGIRKRTEMDRCGQALRHRSAVPITDSGRVVHRITDNVRIGRSHDDQSQFVGDSTESIL